MTREYSLTVYNQQAAAVRRVVGLKSNLCPLGFLASEGLEGIETLHRAQGVRMGFYRDTITGDTFFIKLEWVTYGVYLRQ